MSDEALVRREIRPDLASRPREEANLFPFSVSDGERSRGEAKPPVDHEDRLRLRRDFDRTFFVEAGAGTGKTTELVARIVALVTSGELSMEKLAAITFTEAAAAELRERVRHGLEKAANDSPDETTRDRCRRAAREIDLATIQTIHAFAGTLLRTFPIEAGLPPGFDVWDEIQADLAFDEQFRTWLYDEVTADDNENRPRRDTVRRALLLGMTFEQLHALARALQDQADLLDRETTWPAPAPGDARAVARRWGVEIQKLRDLLPLAKNGDDDKLARHVRDLQFAASRLASARDEADALLALQGIDIKIGYGSQKDWGRTESGVNACALIKECLKSARDEIGQVLAEHRTAVLAALLGYLRDFTLDVADWRRRQGAATFHDLLTWARDLLRDDLDVRTQAQRRFDRIFVDEFQDTDPLQAEIVWFLAADPNQPQSRDWRELRLAPGKLFVVGDPKQSIYRFRRADIALYSRIYEQAADDERAGLVQNFRSLPPVLHWINYHFRQHMRHESGVQAPYVDLQPAEPSIDLNGARWGVYRVGDQIDGNTEEVRATEADVVARIAHQVIADGWLVRDETGSLRRARRRDVCVLMESRRNMRGLEDAFARYGVPFRMESGSLVLDTQEVRDLLSCLRAIDDPSDQVALVAALRSPAYGCSDVDLLRWVEAGGKLDYEQPPASVDGPVAEALASLRRFHAARTRRSPAATIEAFVRERMLAVQTFGQPHPREAWRRLRYVVAQARRFGAAGRTTLRAFVDWIEGLQRIAVRDTETPLPEADEDAVRLLTVHGAKGLEFPIVILTGLGTPPGSNQSTVGLLADRQTGTLQVRCGAFETAGYEAAKEHEKSKEAAEQVRKLYVATTRARDHLVLCLCRGKRDYHAARIAETLDGCDQSLCHSLDVPEISIDGAAERGSVDLPSALAPDEHADDERHWQEARRLLIDAHSSARTVTATDLLLHDSLTHTERGVTAEPPGLQRAAGFTTAPPPSPGSYTPASDDLPPDGPERKQSGPEQAAVVDDGVVESDAPSTIDLDPEETTTAIDADPSVRIGLAVHAGLVQITARSDRDVADVVEAVTRRFGVAERANEARSLIEAALRSPIVQEALASGRFWHEVPVGVEADGTLLEGRIDLLFERSDGSLVIVDFKTDRIDRETVAARADSYRLQGGAYALAVERVTGKPVSSVAFVFAALDGQVEVYNDVSALVDEVRAALQRVYPRVASGFAW